MHASIVDGSRRRSRSGARRVALRACRGLSTLLSLLACALAAPVAPLAGAADSERPVTIAIVDDGVDFSNPTLRPYAWRNARELPGNRIDDDRNNLVDDSGGWDFADRDPLPYPPAGRLDRDHGTYLAHLIIGAAGALLAPVELTRIRIMPVKVMSDAPGELRLRNAYAGVAYAAQQGADVILMAWNDPVISEEEKNILLSARAGGALLIGSAGNLGVDKPMYPAAHEAVLAVAALKDESRLRSSNYGGFVDIAAPGFQIGTRDATEFGLRARDGTSPAAATVAAAAIALFARRPESDPLLVRACLLATATPIDGLIDAELGRLGAGRVDAAAALACLEGGVRSRGRLELPKGVVFADLAGTDEQSVSIAPKGVFDSVDLAPLSIPGFATGDTRVRVVDAKRGRVLYAGTLASMSPISTSATNLTVTLMPGASGDTPLPILVYSAKPRPLQNRFCAEPVELLAPTIIEDGSGAEDYAPGSDCHWVVSAPPGHGLRFTFLEVDTEPRRDLIYLFAGPRTNAEIAAIVSGSKIPETIRVPRSRSLVWFVTDLVNQGAGFRVRVDLEPKELGRGH